MNLAKLLVHCGGVFPNPLLNKEAPLAADTLPATIVVLLDDGKFSSETEGFSGRIKYVLDKNYLTCKTIEDTIKAGENGVGIHPISGMYFNIRAKAGDYKAGVDLMTDGGMVKIGGGDDSAVFFAQETITIANDGDLLRVVVK